jgi:molecular chaperone GrpE
MTEEQNPNPNPPPQVEEENWKDKYLHTLADMENMRKRMQKERSETLKFGTESTVGEFLPAMDNFENALRFTTTASPEVKNWAMGFEMILGQFKEVLSNHGIHPFHSEGTHFDPLLHEAVEIVETMDAPDGTILQEFSKGYKSSQRTIRPARVKVAKQNKQTLEQENQSI